MPRSPLTILLSSILLFSATACAGGNASQSAVERTDSAGIEIVRSTAGDIALAWRLEPVASVDPEHSGAGVLQVNSQAVQTDGQGRIYALDEGEPRIVVFDSEGRYLRTLGRKGGGPGEAEMPISLGVAADGGAAMFDIGKGRLVRFGAEGLPVEEWQLAGYFGGGLHVTGDEVTYERNRMDARSEQRMKSIIRVRGSDTTVLAEMPVAATKPIQLESCGMGFSGMPALFEPDLRWSGAGDRIAVADGATYDIRLFDGAREVRRIRRDVAPRAATATLAQQQLGDGMQVMTAGGTRTCSTEEVVEKRGFAPVVPAIGRIVLSPEGELWVQRTRIRDEEQPIDVFSADGDYLGTLPAGTPLPSGFLPDGRLVAVEKDELDVSRIVIYRVDRNRRRSGS